ncbi:MAG: hypothetical protein P8L85_15080 [Rubripirellula sp.]|nr:hypothetical protein [Rubripirellula sp.]
MTILQIVQLPACIPDDQSGIGLCVDTEGGKPYPTNIPITVHNLTGFGLVQDQYCLASVVDGDWIIPRSRAVNHTGEAAGK